MQTSVMNFPNRGKWGDSRYRGNCSGYVIKALLEHYRPKKFMEIFAGGGTGHDVARDLGYTESVHLDLNPRWGGFNALRDEIPEGADLTFLHPPYHNIITYSGSMWGEAHEDDLSRCSSYAEFIQKLDRIHAKVYASIRKGGRYAVLVGDCRKNGEYFSIMQDMTKIGKLEATIIKLQHNCVSDSTEYAGSGKLIRIEHEYLLIFRKNDWWIVPVQSVRQIQQDIRQSDVPTWRDLVYAALDQMGGQASLSALYEALSGTKKAEKNPHWREKIRQTLQLGKEFAPCERGVWKISAPNKTAA